MILKCIIGYGIVTHMGTPHSRPIYYTDHIYHLVQVIIHISGYMT